MASAESKEDLALNARAVAEKCFLAGNVSSARQWMQSAVRLAPGLPGVAQIAAAYDVHAAAARRPIDWYAVLGLQKPRFSGSGGAAAPVLTHDNIKKQHRRLCLLVHPDKNPSAAADGAFKLIQAAWEALSATHPPPTAATAPTRTPTAATARRPPAPPSSPRPPPNDPPPARPTPQQKRQTPRTSNQWWDYDYDYDYDRADAATARPPPRSRSSPGSCPSCGETTPYGTQRCMVCYWSPSDQCRVENDYYFNEDFNCY